MTDVGAANVCGAPAISNEQSDEIAAPPPLIESPFRLRVLDTAPHADDPCGGGGASSSPAPAVTATTTRIFKLYYGNNTIGRCTPDVNDPSFISIDKANVALSRMHAVVTIAPNNDGWIRDLGSTNGTNIAVREGEGILLEVGCCYQMSHGMMITFGDLHVLFVDSTITPDPPTNASGEVITAAEDSVVKPHVAEAVVTSSSSSAPVDVIAAAVKQGAVYERPDKNAEQFIAAAALEGSDDGAPVVGIANVQSAVGPNFTIDSSPTMGGENKADVSKRPYLDDESETSIPQPPAPAPLPAAAVLTAASSAVKSKQQLSFMDDEDDVTPAKISTHASPVSLVRVASAAEAKEASVASSRKSANKTPPAAPAPPKATPKGKSEAASPKAPAATPAKKSKRGRKDEGEDEQQPAKEDPTDEGQSTTKKARPEAPTAAKGGKKAPTPPPPPPAADEAQRAPTLDEFRSRLPSYVWPEGQKLNACLSGMDTSDRERVANRIRLMGGAVLEEWNDRVTLLVVKDSPSARTPKFLIALAKGILIVTSRFFTDQQTGGNLARLLEFVPDLQHNGAIVSAADVVDVVLYHQQMKAMNLCPHGALSNLMFTVTDLQPKVRSIVSEVITSAGGKVAKTKRDEAKAAASNMRHISLGSDDVEKLYDAIVTGSASRFLLK